MALLVLVSSVLATLAVVQEPIADVQAGEIVAIVLTAEDPRLEGHGPSLEVKPGKGLVVHVAAASRPEQDTRLHGRSALVGHGGW